MEGTGVVRSSSVYRYWVVFRALPVVQVIWIQCTSSPMLYRISNSMRISSDSGILEQGLDLRPHP